MALRELLGDLAGASADPRVLGDCDTDPRPDVDPTAEVTIRQR